MIDFMFEIFSRQFLKLNETTLKFHPNAPILVKAIRNIYSPDLILTSSSNIKITIDILEAEEVTFTLVFNKKHKRKSKVFFPLLYLLLTLEVRHYLFYRLSLFSKL